MTHTELITKQVSTFGIIGISLHINKMEMKNEHFDTHGSSVSFFKLSNLVSLD